MTRILIALALGAFVLVGGATCAGWSWYSTGVQLQEGALAQYRDNQNRYDAFWKTVRETAQIPAQYKDDFKDLLVAETSAKFGEGGSKAAFQWFQERSIQLSPELYAQVQRAIEAGRNDFKVSQTTLLDKQRRLRAHRNVPTGRVFRGFVDFLEEVHGDLAPPKDLDGDGLLTVLDYPIVTSTRTQEAFAAGKDEEVQVFGRAAAADK